MRLSYTALKTFEQCRWWYRIRYLCGIRSAVRPRMALSMALHAALARLYEGLQKGEPGGKHVEPAPGSREALLGAFARYTERDQRLTPEQCEEGRRILAAYWDAQEWRITAPYLVETPFAVSIGPFRLVGRMDRVDDRNGGYEIVDYKLARRATGPPDRLQAQLYQLGLQTITGKSARQVSFYYLRSQQSTVTEPGPVRESEDRIRRLCRAIACEQAFAPTEGPWCGSCDEQELCPAKTRSPRAAPAERRPRQLELAGVW